MYLRNINKLFTFLHCQHLFIQILVKDHSSHICSQLINKMHFSSLVNIPFERIKEISCIFKFTIHFMTYTPLLSEISTSILQSAWKTAKDIVNGIWSVIIVIISSWLHCWDNQLLTLSALSLALFALSATALSNLPGLLVLHCFNKFNHSGLVERGPLLGGVIPKTVIRIDLILSLWTLSYRSLLLGTLQWLQTSVGVNILRYVSQAIANQAIAESEHWLKMMLNIQVQNFKSAKVFSDARNSCS